MKTKTNPPTTRATRARTCLTKRIPQGAPIYFAALFCSLVLSSVASAQVAVTNPGNTTPGLAATYTSLANAITDLNAQTAISGPVIITLTGNETAPAGGYSITAIPTGASATNNIVIQGSSSTITASAALTVGALNDAIFKLIGADWITIQNFTMQENAANTVTAAATNNMTEWGVALLYATTTNGAQNNTIQNNTITLNRTYQNTFGIYSNSTHSATAVTTSATATGAAGGNHNLKIYGNNISNVNQGICVVGPTAAADMNTGLDIGDAGGTHVNIITNWGTTGTFSGYANVSATLNCVLVRNSIGFNVSNNTLTSSVGGNTVTTSERAIYVPSFSNAPTGTFTDNINGNTISVQSGLATGTLNGIIVETTTGTATSSLTINSNDFLMFGHTVAASGAATFINSTMAHLNTTINSNFFSNISLGTTGSVTFISNSITVPAGGSQSISNNFIDIAFNKTGAGGTITGITTGGSSTTVTSNWNNNIFSNITVTGATAVTIINETDGGSVNHNITGNTISNITGGTSAIIGISSTFGGANGGNGNLVSGNTVSNISSAGAITGISIGSSGTTSTVASNTVNTLSSTGASLVVGITSAAPTSATISKNKIYDLSSSNASGTVSGMAVTGGTLHTVFNNLIGDLRATAANAANPLIGLNVTGGTTVNAYFNTVYLAGSSSGALFGSSAVSVSTTPTVTLEDNAFVNASSTTGAGLAVAYRRSTATLTTYGSASNNNDFFGSTTYTDGTNTDVGIAAYKTRVASRDSASFSENPPFLSTTGSSANFLHINTGTPTQLESGGIPVSGITTDFDGDTRNVTTPDVGADEFAGTALDLTPPNIAYTALGNTNLTGARTLTAIITDPSGVPTSGAGLPVLYWKINALSYTSATAASLGGGQYQFSFGSGVSTGDMVSYYVVAQDGAGTPNVGSNPSGGASGFTANPPAASTPPTTPNSYTIVPSISGTFSVGTGQSPYATLTAAVAALNSSVITGPVVFNLTDSTYTGPESVETYPITINANSGSSMANTVTIKPASGNAVAMSASSASSIFKLNGASWIIIDGVNSGGSSLSIQNTSAAATTAVIWLASNGTGLGSTNNTIQNCSILAGSSTVASTYGIALSGTTIGTAGADNDNNTIQNNTISTVYYGIYANGTAAVSAGGVDGLMITNNLIGPAVSGATNTGFAGIWLQNALTATISGNTVRNVTTTVGSTGGIYLNSNVNGATISQNTITNITSTASSTSTAAITALYLGNSVFNTTVSRNTITTVASTTSSGYGVRALIVNTGFSGSNDTIVNNMISDVSNFQDATVTLYATIGIDIEASGGINVWDNSVNLFGDHTGYSGNTAGGVSAALFINTTGTGLDIRDNVLSNSYNNTTSTGDKSYAIYSLSANTVFSAIDYDLYYVAGNATPVLGFINSVDQATVAAIQASFGGNTHSVSGNPQFNSNTDLHINPAIATLVESGGTPIVGITTDIDGDTRNASTPDIGADEGNFTQVVTNDMSATAFIDPTNGGSKPAGVMFSPQASFTNSGTNTQTNVTVRYRICTDGTCTTELYNNTQVIASIAGGVTTPVTFASTSLSAGTYTIKAKSELAGDQIPANDEITGTVTAAAPLSGGYTVGAAGNYPTLTQAVNALNSLGITGPVTLTLLDANNTTAPTNTGEVFPIVINAIAGASSTNTVTIKPATGVTAAITGSVASGAIIKLNGASYVTIDGSNSGGTDRSLTITNSSATSPSVVAFTSIGTTPFTNNTLKNCVIVNGVNTSSAVVVSDSATLGNPGYFSNVTIQNNSVQKAYIGVFANGGTAPQNGSNLVYTQNDLSTTGANAIRFTGLYMQGVNGATVSQNTIGNFSGTESEDDQGIWLATGTINATVDRNVVKNLVYTGTGGYGCHGIAVSTAATGANVSVTNNMIYGLSGDGFSYTGSFFADNPFGIYAFSTQTGVKIYFNSINLSGNTLNQSLALSAGIVLGTGTTADVRDNAIVNNLGLLSATGYGSVGIWLQSASSQLATGDYNDYFVNPTGSGVKAVGQIATTASTTISAWQTATGQEANSKSVDPIFVSATDLHLQTSSTLLGMGVTIGTVANDFDGDLRQSPPDIGADEVITYTLTYTAGANGSISGVSPQTVPSGGSGTAVAAVPNMGYHFVNWSDSSTQNPRTDTNVMADISVTANFAINTYTLTYTAGANGSISGTSPQTVNFGADGSPVTAVPNTGYHFVQWSDSSTQNPRTDTNVMADVNVTATFAINTYTLTYTAGANGSISGTSPQTVNFGADGSPVTAVPNSGYHFVNWSDASTSNPRTDTNVMADISVTANFAINTYTLTYTAGANGSISGTSPQTVNFGADGSPVTAVPNSGYHFVNWSDASTSNPRTDTNVMANISVQANFAINTYTVTYDGNTNTGGTAPVDANSPYNYNSTVTVLGQGTLTKTGYTFAHWNTAANGSGTSYNPTDTFSITADTVLYAQWTLNAATTVYVDDDWIGIPNGQDPDGGGPATAMGYDAFATIQGGIDGVASGGTVIVYAGTYTQTGSGINLNKSLSLLGPNAANSPNSAAQPAPHVRVAEALITGAVSPVLRISLPATSVTIQGFEFDNTGVVDCYDTGQTIAIRRNIYSNGQTNGSFYFLNAPASFTFDDNYLTNAATIDNDAVFMAGNWNGTTGTVVSITNNVIENSSSTGMNLSNVSGAITGNRFTNLRDYAILLAVNSGNITISGNTFDGIINPDPVNVPTWGAGVRFYQPNFLGFVRIKTNLFENSYCGVGVRGVPNDPGADITGQDIHINFNSFINNTYGISDGAAGTLDTENNWWGCNFGPGAGGTGCSGAANGIFNNGSGTVDADPWIVLQVSALPNPITPGGMSTVTADMTHNSNNVVPSGTMFIPDVGVAFSATEGTMNPTSGTIMSGQEDSMFTSTSNNSGTSSATVNGQTVTTPITVTGVTYTIDDVTMAEGDSGPTSFVFTVTKNGTTALTSTVDFMTQDGTATVADGDYQMNSGTLTFAPNQTMMQVTVLVNGDTTYEGDETFTVELSNPTVAGESITGGVVASGLGTILNDDNTLPSFSINDVTMNEGDSGPTSFVFTVTKTGATGLSSSVQFMTQDGTATLADNDYQMNSGTLNFGPTDTMVQVTVFVNGDTTFEPNETFFVNLSNPINATISDGQGTGTITNDDARPLPAIVYVDDDWVSVPNGQDPDGGGPATEMGYDAFATMQGGVNGVANPGTVIVYAGNYPEAVTVNKSLTINGAKAGQNANTRFAAFVPGPNGPKADPAVESILTAAATDPNSGANDTLHVMANNVSFNGFVVDGNNPSLPQGGAVVVGGINTDSRRAIQTEDAAGNPFPANNLAVSYNIMQNFSQRGVELIPGTASNTAPATSGNVITQNLVRNFGLDGIVMAFNAYADVTFNTVVTNDFPTEAGIWVQDFLNTGTPHTMNIANNTVTVGQDNFGGIWVNLAYLAAVNINDNTVNAAAGVTSGDDFTYGIYVTSLRPGTTAQLNGNTVGASGGEFDRGIALWNIGTSPTTTTVKDGSVKRSVDGISLVYNDANFGAAGSSSTANVSGMTVSESQVGVVVDATGSGANTVTLTATNSTLSGNTAANGGGITSTGTGGVASTTVTNSTLSGNSPSGASILLQDASLTVGNTIFNTGNSGTNISALGTSVVSSRGFNLSSDNFGGFLTGTGDQVNTDPMLGPLKNNGGPTLTHAPLIDSPAIDQGKDIGPIAPGYTATGKDQRGFTRPVNDPAIPNAVGGDSSDIGAVELAVGVHPSSAASRKTHGAAGDFDISLPLSGPVGIECRGTAAATNLYQMVLIFENPVTFSGAAVTSGTGTVDSVMSNSVIVAGVSGTQVTINLSGVTDVQTLTVGLFDVDDGVNMGDVGVRMHLMIGDATGNGAVNSSDVTFIKAKLGAVVNGTTFRADVNANGDINSSDVTLTKSKFP